MDASNWEYVYSQFEEITTMLIAHLLELVEWCLKTISFLFSGCIFTNMNTLTQPLVNNIIKTKTHSFTLRNDNIVEVRHNSIKWGMQHTIQNAVDNLTALETITHGKTHPVIIYPGEANPDINVRQFYLKHSKISACAFISSSMIHQLVGNSYMFFSNSKIPIKLFSSETKALPWLRTYL